MSGRILPLEARGLTLDIGGSRPVDGISFTLEAGPCTILLGPNGAGKSLTLRLCHGLLRPTAGSVIWRGPGGGDVTTARRKQAMVFDRPVLLRRSAAANVAYALAVHGIGNPERRRRVEESLESTGLARFADRPARTLSAGEKQRLALARAWALQPEVLFLDEPTANLDPAASREIEKIIVAMDASGTKIVMTTHDIAQARRLADEILFLHQGRLVEHAPARVFFDRPASEEARAFVEGRLLW